MNHKQYQTNRVFSLLNQIENKTNTMAHEIADLKDSLVNWQDGKLKSGFFIEQLSKYIDKVEQK